jgi:hypothetical protein
MHIRFIAILTVLGISTSSQAASLNLAIKYVSYANSSETVLSQKDTAKVVKEINELWAQCDIKFTPEEYISVEPENHGLVFNPTSMNELTMIRSQFDTDNALVVISTGKWNPTGGLGADGANAWATMPGTKPAGIVLEAPVAQSGTLVAHELGHCIGLNHMDDEENLMNPVIYDNSIKLEPWQCETARRSITIGRAEILRT